MNAKDAKRISRELFKDFNMQTKVIKPKKSKVEKYNKWIDLEVEEDSNLDWEPFWKQYSKQA